MDPLAEKGPNITPYAFTHNNPIALVDPDGQFPKPPYSVFTVGLKWDFQNKSSLSLGFAYKFSEMNNVSSSIGAGATFKNILNPKYGGGFLSAGVDIKLDQMGGKSSSSLDLLLKPDLEVSLSVGGSLNWGYPDDKTYFRNRLTTSSFYKVTNNSQLDLKLGKVNISSYSNDYVNSPHSAYIAPPNGSDQPDGQAPPIIAPIIVIMPDEICTHLSGNPEMNFD